ncbi:hypothetical protein OJ252_953 [Cryptosporidium canis]|uniref:Uncharacterized protein n=1 Tax=Cryptosporidium canis TaxID=195482 RepID=A0ABQ8P9H2_9CRYT|nr:hypothetical protein OJ252_953 [Cryptosporidium canis]
MYPQIPFSPSLRSKYSSDNQGGKGKINSGDINAFDGPYSNSMVSKDLNLIGNFDEINVGSEHNQLNDQTSGFPHGAFMPATNSSVISERRDPNVDTNFSQDMTIHSVNPGILTKNNVTNHFQPNNIPLNHIPAFPPPSMPTHNGLLAPIGGPPHHSPRNMEHTPHQNSPKTENYLSKPFYKSNMSSNPPNISIPLSQKAPLSDNVNRINGSSFNKKMQDNKERLEQLNIPRTMLESMCTHPNEDAHLDTLSKPIDTYIVKNSLQFGKGTIPHIGIQEPNSNRNISRSNPRLPPKVPGIHSDNKFKLNLSRPTPNNQIGIEPPETSMKSADICSEMSYVAGLKDTVRPPTAPTFFPSNKSGIDGSNGPTEASVVRNPLQTNNTASIYQDYMYSPGHPTDSKVSKTPHHIHSVRPPTAPNSVSKSSLPKVDLLMNLMDKTVENKRREFEKLNKLKYALSELGDFNKRLLEENTRLKSGNNCSNSQDNHLLSNDASSSIELTKSYQTPMSDIVDPFIPDSHDPSTQISSLKAIINKKNHRISELERKLSNGWNKGEISESDDDILYSLLQRIKDRDEHLNISLEEIEGLHTNTIIEQANSCIKILSEKDYGRLKTMASDVLNQIEFNYKALSVTLDHLFDQQCSTLENIKHEGGLESQLYGSTIHGNSNLKETNTPESNTRIIVNTNNSPRKNFDQSSPPANDHGIFNYKQLQERHVHLKTDHGFPITQIPGNKIDIPEESINIDPQNIYIQNECANKFSEDSKNDQLNKEISVLEQNRDHNGAGFNHTLNQIQEPELYANSVSTKDQNPNKVPKDIPTYSLDTLNLQNFNRDDGHSLLAHNTEHRPIITAGVEHQGYQNGYYQFEKSNFTPGNETKEEQENGYAEGVPPPVLAAYYEGNSSENNDICSMSPLANADSIYFNNSSHYQVSASYSNI